MPVDAGKQLGCFTTAQALAAGWRGDQLATAVAVGGLRRLRRGVFTDAARYDELDVRDRHVLQVRADLLMLAPRWHAARRSAAVLWGLPLLGALPRTPQLVAVPNTATDRSWTRHRHLAELPAGQRRLTGGLALTSPARTAVDLARTESFRSAIVVADAVLALGTDMDELARVLDGMVRWPGAGQARRVLGFADGRAESPLESISRVAIRDLGLPAPELQVRVHLGPTFLGRVDNLWRVHNTVGEADGLGKYALDAPRAERERVLRAERVREQALRDAGLEVVRWTWDEVWRPNGALDVRLLRAFARGDRSELDPRVRFVPTPGPEGLRHAV